MHPPIHPSIHPSIQASLSSLFWSWSIAGLHHLKVTDPWLNHFFFLGGWGGEVTLCLTKLLSTDFTNCHFFGYVYSMTTKTVQWDRNDDKSIKRKWSKIANCCPVTRWCGYDALCKEGKASATNKAQLRRNVSGSLFGDTAVTLPKPSCWRRFNRHWYLLHGSLIYFDGFFCNRVKKRWEKGGVVGWGVRLPIMFELWLIKGSHSVAGRFFQPGKHSIQIASKTVFLQNTISLYLDFIISSS